MATPSITALTTASTAAAEVGVLNQSSSLAATPGVTVSILRVIIVSVIILRVVILSVIKLNVIVLYSLY